MSLCQRIALDGAAILIGGPEGASFKEHEHPETQVTVHVPANKHDSWGSNMWSSCVVPPGAPHTGGWDTGSLAIVFHLAPVVLAVTADEVLSHSAYEIEGGQTQDALIALLGDAVADEVRSGPRDRLFLDSAIHIVAGRLLRNHSRLLGHQVPGKDTLLPKQLGRLREFVESRFENIPTVAESAAVLGFGPQRLTRMLKFSIGLTPHQYVTKLRMRAARSLLKNPRIALAELSFRLGYASQSHLTAVFHRECGETPNSYRKRTLGRSKENRTNE